MRKKGVKLSIGLIVKNEEEYLEQCLESLKPIMEQVPSELLIADTGSDDSTVEIARRYTENVFTYNWENDFAKARNFVLDKACGEWFMQMDADEKLEIAEPIVEFLNSEQSVGYNEIYVCFRNFIYDTVVEFTENYLCRLFRIKPERRYVGIIHEIIPILGPSKYLSGCICHYGYMREKHSGRLIREKKQRNLPLLIKAVEQQPDDPRVLFHLAQEYIISNQYEQAKKILEEVISAKKNADYAMYASKAFWNLNGIYLIEKQYDKSVEIAERYFKEGFELSIETLNIIVNTIKALSAAESYEDAVRYFGKLFLCIKDIKVRVKQGRKDLDSVFHAYNDEFYENALCQCSFTLQKCKRYEDALEKLKDIKGALGYQTVNRILQPWLTELEELQCYKEAAEYYRTLQSGTESQKGIARGLIMGFWEMDAEIAAEISKLLVTDESNPFARVQNLLLRDKAGESISREEIGAVLEELDSELYYESILYIAISHDADISVFLDKCTTNRVKEFAREVYEKNYGVRQGLLKGKFQKEEYQSLKEVLFFAMLREQLTMDTRISLEQLKEFLQQYADEMTFYVESLYRPEILEREERSNLPDEFAFALYVCEGLALRESGDLRAYLACMQEAVKACPAKNVVVKRLIEEVETELREQAQIQMEFDSYGAQVKAIIWDFLQKKNYDAAREALMAYEKVNPLDVDITEMKAQLGIFPS